MVIIVMLMLPILHAGINDAVNVIDKDENYPYQCDVLAVHRVSGNVKDYKKWYDDAGKWRGFDFEGGVKIQSRFKTEQALQDDLENYPIELLDFHCRNKNDFNRNFKVTGLMLMTASDFRYQYDEQGYIQGIYEDDPLSYSIYDYDYDAKTKQWQKIKKKRYEYYGKIDRSGWLYQYRYDYDTNGRIIKVEQAALHDPSNWIEVDPKRDLSVLPYGGDVRLKQKTGHAKIWQFYDDPIKLCRYSPGGEKRYTIKPENRCDGKKPFFNENTIDEVTQKNVEMKIKQNEIAMRSTLSIRNHLGNWQPEILWWYDEEWWQFVLTCKPSFVLNTTDDYVGDYKKMIKSPVVCFVSIEKT